MNQPVIEVSHLAKAYGERRAVADVSLHVAEGEVVGVLGPNGAGKTTTVECIAGLRVADAGVVRVAGLDPWTEHDALTRVLGVQLQESQLQPKITVREALDLFSSFYDTPRAWPGLAERLGLTEKLDDRFGRLSGGQQQRLAIALALVGDPRVVVLDELTTGLDPRARRDVWDLVREVRDRGTTVLLVTHQMEEAQQLCDRIALIDAGRVTALGTPEELVDGLGDGTGAGSVLSFVPSAPLAEHDLRGVDGVSAVRTDGDRLVVEGSADAVSDVLALVYGRGQRPARIRVTDGGLDQAYLDLTESTTQKESL